MDEMTRKTPLGGADYFCEVKTGVVGVIRFLALKLNGARVRDSTTVARNMFIDVRTKDTSETLKHIL